MMTRERESELAAMLDGVTEVDMSYLRQLIDFRQEDITSERDRVSQHDVSRGELEDLIGRVTLLEFASTANRGGVK